MAVGNPWLLDQIQLVQGDLTKQKKKQMPKLGKIRHGVIVGLKWVKGNDHISGFGAKIGRPKKTPIDLSPFSIIFLPFNGHLKRDLPNGLFADHRWALLKRRSCSSVLFFPGGEGWAAPEKGFVTTTYIHLLYRSIMIYIVLWCIVYVCVCMLYFVVLCDVSVLYYAM